MQTPVSNPGNWLTGILSALQWPFVVVAAFVLGRYVTRLEQRVLQTESNVKALIERHMPHIHKGLRDIAECLEVLKTMVSLKRMG